MAERGAAGVELSPPFLATQRFFVALQRRGLLLTLTLTLAPTLTLALALALVFTLALSRRGVLLCLVSRNLEEDVRAVLRGRAAELELREEHVVALLANWDPKSANLTRLAHDLCLDLGPP